MATESENLTIRQYCERYAKRILVRHQVEGKWENYSLDKLPDSIREQHIRVWEYYNFFPYRDLKMSGEGEDLE